MEVHAEIEYREQNGNSIHSDICPPGCSSENMNDEEWRKLMHDCLDEWISKSGGTGIFYIKGEDME